MERNEIIDRHMKGELFVYHEDIERIECITCGHLFTEDEFCELFVCPECGEKL